MANNSNAFKETSRSSTKPRFHWSRFLMEFISIFSAVVLAFALNNWNDNRKTRNAETNILKEISNGLILDASDVEQNIRGHQNGLKALTYFRRLVQNKPVAADSVDNFRRVVLRDFISIQNTSGYESLKSQGLDIIKNDALRFEIISMYEYNFALIEKLEEHYYSQQFFETYSDRFDSALSSNLIFDEKGNLSSISTPLSISPNERNRFLLDLTTIENDREFTLRFYDEIAKQIERTKAMIDTELDKRD